MKITDYTFVEVDEFARKTAEYKRRAEAGEKIIVTLDGQPRYALYLDIAEVKNLLNNWHREINLRQNESLLEMPDPHDEEPNHEQL